MKTPDFEWDDSKNLDNIAKHGVSFQDAQRVFQDEHRVILDDSLHSDNEQRYFCLGKVFREIITVRFAYRGGKERSAMKKKTVYTAEPPDVDLERAVRVKDFLPDPKTIIIRKERVVAVRLDDSTVSELKKVADQKGLGVSSLVRMWVRERLSKAHASV